MTEQQNLSVLHAALYPNDRTQQFISLARGTGGRFVSQQMLSRDVLSVPTPPEISLPAGKCSHMLCLPHEIYFPAIPFIIINEGVWGAAPC